MENFLNRLDREDLKFHRICLIVENSFSHNWHRVLPDRLTDQKNHIFAGSEYVAALLLNLTSGAYLELRYSYIGFLERIANVFGPEGRAVL
jgi:hypothetical protein